MIYLPVICVDFVKMQHKRLSITMEVRRSIEFGFRFGVAM